MTKAGVKRLKDYLTHILQAAERIDRYVSGLDQAMFLASEEKQDAVIRNLEIVGEAAQNIRRNYPDFATHHPELPWSSAAAMRNALTHGYFDVDLKIVWKTVIQDVPRLSATVRSMLSGVG